MIAAYDDITGGVSLLEPTWGIEGFDPYIASSIVGLVAGIFRICPSLGICSCRMLVIDTVLVSSLAVVALLLICLLGRL